MADDNEELRRKVALSCRILGVEIGSGGHSSARVPATDQMLLRCRGGEGEGSLAYTDMHHVRLVDFDGEGPGLGDKHFSPHETPLHGEIYRALPDVGAVVHIHPLHAMLCGVTNVEFKPVFAAFNPGLLRIALAGVPTYPRAATVVDKEMAAEMIDAMGGRDILQLRGHGIVATGPTIEAATSLAIRFESLAKIMWQIVMSGREPIELSTRTRRATTQTPKIAPSSPPRATGNRPWVARRWVGAATSEGSSARSVCPRTRPNAVRPR